jgi:hypothetical protein
MLSKALKTDASYGKKIKMRFLNICLLHTHSIAEMRPEKSSAAYLCLAYSK